MESSARRIEGRRCDRSSFVSRSTFFVHVYVFHAVWSSSEMLHFCRRSKVASERECLALPRSLLEARAPFVRPTSTSPPLPPFSRHSPSFPPPLRPSSELHRLLARCLREFVSARLGTRPSSDGRSSCELTTAFSLLLARPLCRPRLIALTPLECRHQEPDDRPRQVRSGRHDCSESQDDCSDDGRREFSAPSPFLSPTSAFPPVTHSLTSPVVLTCAPS